ncbi:MAG: hypothetical protein ACO1OD_00070 [Croceibacterium sp.]
MTLDDLPPERDFEAIFDFAMKFDGYTHHGSFDACARAAKSRKRDSLDALRNELFFEARASRHTGSDSLTPVYRQLVPLFRQFLAGREQA